MANIRFNKAIQEALREEMLRDPCVFVAGEDVAAAGGPFGVTRGLLAEFGEHRVIDTPISESAIAGMAIGASATGMRAVVEIMFMDFLAVCYDPILNQAAKMSYMTGGKMRVPMVIRTAGGAGTNAGPQHSQSLEAMLMHIPGIKVVYPSNPYDAKGLMKASIRDENPVIFIEHKALYGMKGEVPEEDYLVPLGLAHVCQPGEDCTIVAFGQMVHRSMAAAQRLKQQGIGCEVIDLRTIQPLDRDAILTSVKKTGRLVIVHEAVKTGGIGAEIAAMVQEEAFYYLDAPIVRVAAPFSPVPFSKPLEDAYLPDEEAICQAVRQLCPTAPIQV